MQISLWSSVSLITRDVPWSPLINRQTRLRIVVGWAENRGSLSQNASGLDNSRQDRITANEQCDVGIWDGEYHIVGHGNYPQKRQWHDAFDGEYECDALLTTIDVETTENTRK